MYVCMYALYVYVEYLLHSRPHTKQLTYITLFHLHGYSNLFYICGNYGYRPSKWQRWHFNPIGHQ